jgi:hypothetical protein
MRKSIRSRLVAAFVVAFAGLGVLAGTASASNNGASGIDSVHSIFASPVGGTCNAAFNTPAGYVSRSYPSNIAGYPGEFCFSG